MKLLFITGPGAVGKMTVGQELCKITDFRLFHNHMMIEPVLDVFGYFDVDTICQLRDVVFKNYAQKGECNLIYTFMLNYNLPFCVEYVKNIIEIFKENCLEDVEIYNVELDASLDVRLSRNTTTNRKRHKKSKKDEEDSKKHLMTEELGRYKAKKKERICENYLYLNNENISAKKAAKIIKETFNL